MKLLALMLLCATAYLNNAAPTTQATVDYRERYDHLLMEVINERIREGERFLEHLSHQLKEYQTSHKEEVREHIVRELNFILPLVKGVEQHFEQELKKTGLDMLERFTIEKARDEGLLVIKALTEVQKQVQVAVATTKAPVFFAATEKPVDYRSEYDRLLFATIEERIQRADGMLLFLNRQLEEYLKTKSAEVKQHIVAEVNFSLPLLKMAEDHAQNELKRTDLNYLERFLYEKAQDQVKLLIKHYTQIETAVNGKPSVFEYFAATTVAPVDWRSEYDRLLFELTEQNVRRADELLVRLQRQVNEYKQTKNKEIATRVAQEVDFTLPLVKGAQEHAQRELKRTDLNQVERYLFEKINDEATILVKYYTALEKEVKGVAFFEIEVFLAPANRSAEVRAIEAKFLEISHEVREYSLHKTDEAKTKIVAEIDAELAKIKDLVKDLETDLAATHGILERFHVEREIRLLTTTQAAYRREEERVKGPAF
jgi:DNA-binding transcriptional regulator GbsR (MarR family)